MIEIVRSEHVKIIGLPPFIKPYLKDALIVENPVYLETIKYKRRAAC